ncbi:unnamed protein product, partial [Oppiella nova]
SLRLSQASLGKTTVGQIVNIMSNDVNRFDEVCSQAVLVILITWEYLGISSIVGLALFVLYIPFQLIMGKLFSMCRTKTAKLTDSRLRLMNEIISGMRVIKMYTWEQSFSELVAKARKLEVNDIRKVCYLKAINLSLFLIATKIILFCCFLTYVLLGNILSSKKVFVTMALFNMLRITLTWIFPQGIAQGSELLDFLELDEKCVKPNGANQNGFANGLSNGASNVHKHSKGININNFVRDSKVSINNITAKWSEDIKKPTLDNISLHLKPGDLLAVIGPVGSGKSSLLMTILQELELLSGSIQIEGTVSYSAQEPWNFNNSVRNNILFGTEYDEHRYKQVVEVCALARDLKLFPYGDRTLVGEKGVSLSGGQKARINLARNADICLMDDPLSAVDASVAEHIFEKCIVSYLSNKIRILVTHQIQFIRKATKILVLDDGKCVGFGTFDELIAKGLDFMSLLEADEEEEDSDDPDSAQVDGESSTGSQEILVRNGSVRSSVTVRADSIRKRSFKRQKSQAVSEAPVEEAPQIQDEQRIQGSIGGRVYWEYIKAGCGPILGSLTLLSTIVSQVIFHASDLWLMTWTNNEGTQSEEKNNFALIIYSVLIIALLLSTMVRSMTWFAICMIASKRLHNTIFIRLLRAPMAVFDNNPIGRILNRWLYPLFLRGWRKESLDFDDLTRCSKDDEALKIVTKLERNWNKELLKPKRRFWWVLIKTYGGQFAFPVLIFGLGECIVRIGQPLLLGFVVDYFSGATYLTYQQACMAAGGIVFGTKTAKLTDSRLRLMNEIISGMRVIKMYTWEQSFSELVARARKLEVNDIRKVCYLKAINLSLFLIATKIILFCCFLTYVLLGNILSSKKVFVTMALFNMLRITLTWIFPQGIAQGSELLDFLELDEKCVKPNGPNQNGFANGLSNGSSNGYKHSKGININNFVRDSKVNINNITAKWSEDIKKPTLDNISLHLKPGDLLAVIGPVGSGKSSLLMTILQELELLSGSIQIEGTVSYSAQEPWNFNNSVRNNILFGTEYDEHRYKQVVEVCALERDLKLFPYGDRTLVGEKGVSLSGGQKARINLARNADICLMDDPLSAVDASFIRKATKILVLDDGKCVGFGTFDELIAKGLDFMSLLEADEEEDSDDPDSAHVDGESSTGSQEILVRNGSVRSSVTVRADSIRKRSFKRQKSQAVSEAPVEEAPQIQDEQRIQGSIGGRVYWEYIKAGCGPILGSLTLLSTIISQVIFHASDLWLMTWTNNEGTQSEEKNNFALIIYSVLIIALLLSTMVRSMTWFAICMIASKRLHNTIFIRLLRAPMAVFDNNPIGRILNRFTKDLG